MDQRPAVLTKVFRGFPQSIQANASVVPYIRPTAVRSFPAPAEIESKISSSQWYTLLTEASQLITVTFIKY
jgi:hypothetical protein